jgi:hypothetical protein
MNRLLLLLLIAVVAVGCATEKRISRDAVTNVSQSSEEAFARIYGIPGISTMIDSYDGVLTMEGVQSGGGLDVYFRTRHSSGDIRARWMSFNPRQINRFEAHPYLVQASCADVDCDQIAVLVSYAPERGDVPQIAGVMLFRSQLDPNYFEVGFSSSQMVQTYQ